MKHGQYEYYFRIIGAILARAALIYIFCLASLASAVNRYVALNGTNDSAGGFTNWIGAATNIQDAVNVAANGETVWVSNGVYEVGGVTNFPAGTILSNRVAIYKAITVRSANNDPANTIIKGAWDPGATNGAAAVRCVYMTNGSSLIGFTLTNGATFGDYPVTNDNHYGGGVWSQSTNTIISNCVIAGNSAQNRGGGAYLGTLYNCTVIRNVSGYRGAGVHSSAGYNSDFISNSIPATGENGGGAYGGGSIFYNCSFVANSCAALWAGGAGAYYATLYNCRLIANRLTGASSSGAGANLCTMYNCLVVSNNSSNVGGGTRGGTLYNCTIVSNYAAAAGGVYDGTLINCIVYYNASSTAFSNWYNVPVFTNSCTAPTTTVWAAGNITANPLFVNKDAGNYRLINNSPCINAGVNFSWMTTNPADPRSKDFDGRSRIDRFSGIVDMGAYEHIYKGTIFIIR